VPAFSLEPPEVIHPVPVEQAREAVPLKPEVQQQVDAQVLRFIDALASEDLHSDAFRQRLDSAFALGKEEVSNASALMQGRLMQRNFVGVEDSPAYKAIADIRAQLDELNPGKDGDLMQPRKLLGIIPFGSKLEAYFRKYQSAAEQLKTSMGQLYTARDDLQKDVVDIEATRGKLWDAMTEARRRGALCHPRSTQRLEEKVKSLEPTDPHACAGAAPGGAVLRAPEPAPTSRPSRRCASTATWRWTC
jgi:uncharacterized protein YaaN involved in tellurite resistance